MTSLVAKIFNLADNRASVIFEKGGTAIDFTNATRFTLDIAGSVRDTDITAGIIIQTAIVGELEFDLGGLAIAVGSYAVTLKWYDVSHANGQILACIDDQELVFHIKDC